MKLINIGFGNMVSAGRVLSVVSPDSAPIKRIIQEARDRGMLIDASFGRKTKAVILMDTDHVILSAIPTENIYARWMDKQEGTDEEDVEADDDLLVSTRGGAGDFPPIGVHPAGPHDWPPAVCPCRRN